MKHYELINKFIAGLSKGYTNSLIVLSPTGYGKTSTTIDTMKEFGYIEGTHYLYVSNYLTPIELYLLLQKVNKLQSPRLLILDDVEEILKNPQTIGLLKGALGEIDGRRRVFWMSGTHKIQNKQFDFNGRIIFLLNQLTKKSAIVNAFKDRSMFYEIDLSEKEIEDLILERAKKPYFDTSYGQRIKVAKFLIDNKKLSSLRVYTKTLNLMLFSPNHWQELSLALDKL